MSLVALGVPAIVVAPATKESVNLTAPTSVPDLGQRNAAIPPISGPAATSIPILVSIGVFRHRAEAKEFVRERVLVPAAVEMASLAALETTVTVA